LLDGAVDALDHKFLSVTQGLDISTDTHRASLAVEQVLGTLAQLRPAASSDASTPVLLREQQMLGRVARQFRLPEEQLRTRLLALRRAAKPRTSLPQAPAPKALIPKPTIRLSELSACDRLLLEVALSVPSSISRIESSIDIDEIDSEVGQQIFSACVRISQTGELPVFQRLLGEFDDPSIKSLLVDLDETCSGKPEAEPERLLQDLFAAFERRRQQFIRRQALASGQQDEDFALAELNRMRLSTHAEGLKQWEQKRR
jgi:DNA primase